MFRSQKASYTVAIVLLLIRRERRIALLPKVLVQLTVLTQIIPYSTIQSHFIEGFQRYHLLLFLALIVLRPNESFAWLLVDLIFLWMRARLLVGGNFAISISLRLTRVEEHEEICVDDHVSSRA